MNPKKIKQTTADENTYQLLLTKLLTNTNNNQENLTTLQLEIEKIRSTTSNPMETLRELSRKIAPNLLTLNTLSNELLSYIPNDTTPKA